MMWASREPAEEVPEVAPEGPGGGAGAEAGAEEIPGSPETRGLVVSACQVPTGSHKVRPLCGGIGRAECPGTQAHRRWGQPALGQGNCRWVQGTCCFDG